jgi:hypothetical protein
MIVQAMGWSAHTRQQRFDDAAPVSLSMLAGASFRGVSLGLPSWVDRLAWKTFRKDVAPPDADGVVRGWNVRLVQTGPTGPMVEKRRGDRPVRFGRFVVVEGEHGLELSYDDVRNGRWSPMRRLRDPLRRLDDEGAWLLGRSDLWVRGRRLPTPSWFVLQRVGVVDRGW